MKTFDEAKFRRALPFDVRPTDIPGVFDVPPPAPGFDPRTATAEEFRRAGMRWRRSVANRNPIARALWERVTARSEAPVGETVTAYGPPPHPTLPTRRRRQLPDEGDYNWAGAIVAPGNWTAVIGCWVVPTLSQPPQPATTITYPNGDFFTGWWVNTWVGLDGYQPIGSNDILQVGIAQQIDTNNNVWAWAWYEWWLENPPAGEPAYVNAQTVRHFKVAPGDTIIAIASYVGSMAGQVTILNFTQWATRDNFVAGTGNHFNKVLAPPSGADFNGASAEWIVEDPGGGESGLFGQPAYSLAAFTPIAFTGALACNCASDLASMNFADPSSATLENIETAGSDPTTLTSTTVGQGTATITFVGG
jgi:Peptidase A4 family